MMSVCANQVECTDYTSATNFTSYEFEEILSEVMLEWISFDYLPWMWAMFGSILVGLSGVLPLLVIPIDQTDDLKQGG